MTGRRILAIPGVLALLFATTIGVGITPAGATKYPPPPFKHGLHCGYVHHFGKGGFTEEIDIFGSGFHGQPSITSNEKGTRFVVTHDHGNELIVMISIPFGSKTGKYTFTIKNPDSTSCKLDYISR
jgi:hypothetical protein